MAGVTIDIPGIGNVEAKNAATEATLKEILKAIKSGGTGGGNNTTGGTAPGGDAGKTSTLRERADKAFSGLVDTSKKLTSGFSNLAKGGAELLSTMANVGDSLESAASAISTPLSKIPIVGGAAATAIQAVAGAATSVVGSFQQAAGSGATFGGSIVEFSRAASGAGLTMEKFAGIIAKNGEAMMLLGGTTESGAKRFSQLGKTMRESGLQDSLLRMGYSTEQINEGMAGYISIVGKTGALQNMSTQQIAQSSAAYLKDLDALAKITGQTREEKQKEQQALMRDAQLRAAMAGMDADAQKEMMNYITSFPAEQQAAIKDMIATGTATTEEAIKLNAMLPGAAQQAMEFGRQMKAGGRISQDAMNTAKNSAIMEAREREISMREQGLFNKEFSEAYLGTSNLARQEIDGYSTALKQGADAQKKSNLAENLSKAKQSLSEFSNSFQMALAGSGMLDTLMTAFGAMASFVQNIVVPAFQFMAPIINQIVTTAASLLIPAFQWLGSFISAYIVPVLPTVVDGLRWLGSTIAEYVVPVFVKIAEFISDNVVPTLIFLGTTIAAMVIPALIAKAKALWSVVGPLLATAAPFIAIGAAAALAVYGFNKLGGSMDTITDSLEFLWSGFKTFLLYLKLGFLKVLDALPFVDLGDQIKETEKELDEESEIREKLATKIVTDAENNRKAQKDRDDARAARDTKFANQKFSYEMKGIGAKSSAELKAIDDKKQAEQKTSINYSSPEATLKSFAKQQKSGLVTEKAETTKQAMTAEAEQKQTEAKLAAEEQKKAAEQMKETGKGTGTAPGVAPKPVQESQESLLARLNTNMEELLNVQRRNMRIAEKQLGVQEGLSGDVFAS